LSDYLGISNIDIQYVIKRREIRYKYETINYAVFGFEKRKKEKNIIYKGLIKSRLGEPREGKLEILDRECETQTIDRQSTVDKPLMAAAHIDMNKNHIGNQSQGVERNYNLFDGKTCLASETDSRNLIEDAHHFIRFRRSYIRSSIRKLLNRKWSINVTQMKLFGDVEILHLIMIPP
jgi:hypothetical protein